MLKNFGIVVAGCLLSALAAQADVTVSNLSVAQRPGTKLVDISYDLFSPSTNALTVSLEVSSGSEALNTASASGDVGTGITPGPDKAIVWDMALDWDGQLGHILYTVVVGGGSAPPCPVPKTGQSMSYHTGDDGDHQAGAAWPVPRFTNNDDGTVTDKLTGLEWVKTPHALAGNSGTMLWDRAIDFCSELSLAGHDDWRLPNIREHESLLHGEKGVGAAWLNSEEHPFYGVQDYFYWSGTTYAHFTNQAYVVSMSGLYVFSRKKTDTRNYVWPVRSEE